jgi:lipid II:glycine glycyltransferase (peptidoglycan interpeptide bridge formation enzyme)
MYAPRGPVCDLTDQATFHALINGARELAKKHKAYVLKMDPDVPGADASFSEMAKAEGFCVHSEEKNFNEIQPRFVFRLYLEGRGEEEIMASFHSKTRYNIRVAQKNGVEVLRGTKTDVARFHEIMMETGLRDGFVIRSCSYFENMLGVLGEHARLYMAYHEGKAVAGTLCVRYGDKVWYLYGASSNTARNVMPNYLLQWEMIRWAIECGCRIYDFRGVSGDLRESNPLYGLYRFKKGFNGELTEFIGEMDLEFSPLMNFAVTNGEKVFRRMRKYYFLLRHGRGGKA